MRDYSETLRANNASAVLLMAVTPTEISFVVFEALQIWI